MNVNMVSKEQKELKINDMRFMTLAEFDKYQKILPKVPNQYWWLEEADSDSAYFAERNSREADYVCRKDEPNTYLRPVLEIDGAFDAGFSVGDKFILCGIVFVILDNNLAISENFVGAAKFHDSELDDFCLGDDLFDDDGIEDDCLDNNNNTALSTLFSFINF